MISRRLALLLPLAVACPTPGRAAIPQSFEQARRNCARLIEKGMERRVSTLLTIGVASAQKQSVADLDRTRMIRLAARSTFWLPDSHDPREHEAEVLAALVQEFTAEVGGARLAAIVGRNVVDPTTFEPVMVFRARIL